MSKKKKSPPNLYPLPDGVELTPDGQEQWERLTRLLPLNTGPRLLFVLVEPPLLRRMLADHLAAALHADGHTVARLDFSAPQFQPLQEIFDIAAKQLDARFGFLFGLERSLNSAEHHLSALTDLNFHRDQISKRLSFPLVIWTTDAAFTDLARNAPDFIAWRSGVFNLADPSTVIEAPYRQHVIDHFGKLTLYSATADAPLAVDLERVFVKLTATQRRRVLDFAQQEGGRTTSPSPSLVRRGDAVLPLSKGELEGVLPIAIPSVEETTVTLSIGEALRDHLCLTIVGAPGAGKTTLLKYLALTFARGQAEERLELKEERLPIFVALRDLNRFLSDRETPKLTPQLLTEFIKKRLKEIAPYLDLPTDFFERALADKRCAVLLDGMDEVADAHKRSRVAEAVAVFVQGYPGNRFVVTSRPHGYEGEAKRRLTSLCADCTIRDFDDDDMTKFAHSWYEAVVRDRLGNTPDAKAEAERNAEDLLRGIRASTHVKALAHNPLLLSVLAMVHQRNTALPQRRAELYDECTEMLLGYWDQTKGGEAARELASYGELNRNEKRTLLEPIALWFHERGEQGLEAGVAELEKEIARQFEETFGDDSPRAKERAQTFLRVIDERAGLLVERETGVYAFAHLTFQEYLAARAIADDEDYIEYTLRHLHEPWWREVILLEVGHLSDMRHFGRRARRLTTDLIRAIRDAGSPMEAVLKRDFLFSCNCLFDTGLLGVDDKLRGSLMDELISLWHETPYEPQKTEVVDLFGYAMPTLNGVRIRAELLGCLADEFVIVRLYAARALGQMGEAAADEGTIGRLIDLLAGELSIVCLSAASALGEMGEAAADEGTIGRLVDLFADEDASVRSSAANALGEMGEAAANEGTIGRLINLFADEDRSVRDSAAWALGQMGEATANEGTIGRLINLFADEDGSVRDSAASALGEMGEAAADEGTIGRLINLFADADASVRSSAASALGKMGEAAADEGTIGRLIDLFADADASVRSSAASALGKMGEAAADEGTISRLIDLLADADKWVRYSAGWALGRMGEAAADEGTIGRLIDLFTDADADRRVRSSARSALGQMGKATADEGAIGRLIDLLADADAWVRSSAASALGKMGEAAADEGAVGRLIDLLADSDASVRNSAANALGRMGEAVADEGTIGRLIDLLADANAWVRYFAAEALGQMGVAAETAEVLGQLTKFWQSQLKNTEGEFFGDRYGRVCDIAYEELQRIVGLKKVNASYTHS